MTVPENPPGFVVRTEAHKSAWDNGYRISNAGSRADGCTTPRPPHLARSGLPRLGSRAVVALARPFGCRAEIGALAGHCGLRLVRDSRPFGSRPLTELHVALDRVYKLAVSLPEAPLDRFKTKTANLPRTTEAERMVIQRIGQDVFRDALWTTGAAVARDWH